jgi:hypothetical protein
MRDFLAAVLCELVVEPVWDGCVGAVWGRVFVGFAVSVGMASVPQRRMVVLPVAGMGLAAGRDVLRGEQYCDRAGAVPQQPGACPRLRAAAASGRRKNIDGGGGQSAAGGFKASSGRHLCL